jgi:hypothetical protein
MGGKTKKYVLFEEKRFLQRTTSQRSFWAFLAGKNIKFLFPADTEVNITRVNSLRKASNSLNLMANNALIAICLIHLLPLAKF